MKNTYIRSAILLTITSFSLLSAQSMLAYKYPTGIPLTSSAGPSLSLGRTGVAIQNDFLGMSKNPANLGTVQRSVFSSVLSYDLVNLRSNGERSTQSFFNPQLLSFAFPLKASFGAIGLSLEQRSNMALSFNTKNTVSYNGVNYTEMLGIKRSGGISCWQIGYGYTIKKLARIGLTYERVYLRNRTTNYKKVTGLLESMQNDSFELETQANGIRGGIIVPYKKFTGGISGEYFFGNTAKIERSINTTSTSFTPSEADYKLAPSLSFGASYQFTPEWLAAADLGVTLWDRYYSGFETNDQLDNTINISGGAQFIPAPTLLAPKYYEIIQYRAGVRYAQMPVSTAAEWAVDLGFGLPLQQNGSMIDLNIEYGRRTDSNYEKFTEEFISLQIGINGGRKWYQTSGTSY